MLTRTLFYTPTVDLAPARTVQTAPKVDTSGIGERNFFGLAAAEPEIVLEELPVTPLNLILRGALTAINDANAGAIIENDKRQAEHFAIGDVVAENTTLKSVHSDRVVLARNGIFETLYFPGADDSPISSSGGGFRASTPISGAVLPSSGDSEERRKAIRERIEKMKQARKETRRN